MFSRAHLTWLKNEIKTLEKQANITETIALKIIN
jgi:hypothetical protein